MKFTIDLNKQSTSGIKHPAEWNTWYLYIRARMQDTLNAEERAIMEELWSMTNKMNHLVTRGIIARRKSLLAVNEAQVMGKRKWNSRRRAVVKAKLQEMYGRVCGICGKDISDDEEPSLDHIIPTAVGGSKTMPENLQLAHAECNRRKAHLIIPDGERKGAYAVRDEKML